MAGEGEGCCYHNIEELEDAQGQVELSHHFEKLQTHSKGLPRLSQRQNGVLP